jgi:hypothetical protein
MSKKKREELVNAVSQNDWFAIENAPHLTEYLSRHERDPLFSFP